MYIKLLSKIVKVRILIQSVWKGLTSASKDVDGAAPQEGVR